MNNGKENVILYGNGNGVLEIPLFPASSSIQINDTFLTSGIDDIYPNNVVTVYNRLGNKVYESKQGAYNTMPWDGTHQGNELPVASYYYIIEYNDNSTENTTGIVSIIK